MVVVLPVTAPLSTTSGVRPQDAMPACTPGDPRRTASARPVADFGRGIGWHTASGGDLV